MVGQSAKKSVKIKRPRLFVRLDAVQIDGPALAALWLSLAGHQHSRAADTSKTKSLHEPLVCLLLARVTIDSQG